ncbi:HAT dimerization, partial [Trametes versicolor FP-101664 SS1]|uniref:HAT dimerization n=1 Tax=Trametes versicolor (strain FP-101664) TaxID=717944 RepID=UPI0004621FC3
DELTRYLASAPEPTNDALAWWSERRGMYPHLARMALDYLSIPATSVDVERTFSRGRRLLSHVRSRLSAQTTRAVLCLGDWVRWDMVRPEDV